MVIQQFNRLIRNKWFWGAFAIVVSAAFCCPDDFFRGDRSGPSSDSGFGTLGGKDVNSDIFRTEVKVNRGFERMAADRGSRSKTSSAYEMNHRVWLSYAAAETAEANGVAVDDKALAAYVVSQFGGQNFDAQRYRQILNDDLGVTVKDFEAVMRRTLEGYAASSLIPASVWASPMETDVALYDKTDKFTVKVVEFAQTKEEADAVKMDDEGLKKWYDANTKQLELPELVKIRYVAFDATATNVLAKMAVTDDDLHDLYDASGDKYKSTDTNGVETVKAFDEVKGEIEKEYRQSLAVNYFVTNLNDRAFAGLTDGVKGDSRVDKIAAEEGLKVAESDWFSAGDNFFMLEGFAVHPGLVLPGVKYDELISKVRQLDPESDFERYTVLASNDKVYLVERAAKAAPHTPTFEEAKGKIGKRALRDAKADAFKAKVDAIIAKGAEAVVATAPAATNISFTADIAAGTFPNQYKVIEVAQKLKKGEVSEFTRIGSDKAIVVVCVDREADPGSISALAADESVSGSVSAKAAQQLMKDWSEWNLARLGYVTGVETIDVEPKSTDED